MHTIKAIYDGTNFKPVQPIPVKGNYEVFITFIEPIKNDIVNIEQIKHARSGFIGSWKDKIWMSEDFNEPLEEMEEYME